MKVTPEKLRVLASHHRKRGRYETARIIGWAATRLQLHGWRIIGLVRDNKVLKNAAVDLAEDCHRLRAELRDMRIARDIASARSDTLLQSLKHRIGELQLERSRQL